MKQIIALPCNITLSTYALLIFGVLGCPYSSLSDGPVTQRLVEKKSKLCLLDYLLTELQATRMLAVNKPEVIAHTAAPMDTVKYFEWYCIDF